MPRTTHLRPLMLSTVLLVAVLAGLPAAAEENMGYYRFPTLAANTVVFTAEGDLWKVPVAGGLATRLTTHHGLESHAALSDDGQRVAFNANYEGPREVYVMDVEGSRPERLTWGNGGRVIGWTPDGWVLFSTAAYSGLPDAQLVAVDPATRELRHVPLSQAAEGVYGDDGTLFFTRIARQGSHTKRYKGGTAENLWRFADGADEAVPLTADYTGTSHQPMFHDGRVFFVSDRDGTMNVFSMAPDGSDVQQHTERDGWDAKDPDESDGRIVYQSGADLYIYTVASDSERKLDIRLSSDFDQTRERWVEDPNDYLTAASLSPNGDRVVLTARGQVFVAPTKAGRFVRVTRDVYRYRSARFLAGDEDEIAVLSDESGEVELHLLDPRGIEEGEQLSRDGESLRFEIFPSPDGQRLAYFDREHELWVFDRADGRQKKVATSRFFGFNGLNWSPDSRWLAYGAPAENQLNQVVLYDADNGTNHPVTSDRFNSFDPTFSPDGKFLYFLSDRNLRSVVGSPWGNYAPQPYIASPTKVYLLALQPGTRSPFAAATELDSDGETSDGEKSNAKEGGNKKDDDKKSDDKKDDSPAPVEIAFDGIEDRLEVLPIAPGNYNGLSAQDGKLYWLSIQRIPRFRAELQVIKTEHKAEVKTLLTGLEGYDISADGKKILIRMNGALHVVDAGTSPLKDLGKSKVDLSAWTLSVEPRLEWRQLYVDAWRLLRDYFYDPGMHGVDWPAMRDKYLPLIDRVRARDELSDVLAELTGELSALHHFVYGGDIRRGEEDIDVASLGAHLIRDDAQGGWVVKKRYRSDPDMPEERGPLAHPNVNVKEGDVILAINGVDLLTSQAPGQLLRQQQGKQVLLKVKDGGDGSEREVIVEPISGFQNFRLRYGEWELERREIVEELGEGEIGYVHLTAMGGRNYTEWARNFFPVYNRKGLILDVRHNTGGNIDSWILGALVRKAWMWWKARETAPYYNMQYAFNGHMVILCNERTASDGEAVTDGFRRLGLGKVIGTRTWGGEIWLTSSNVLIDRGIATAGEFGVYGPEGEWLIEGHGVDPDMVVDNPPHATWNGEDAQLKAAIEYLQKKIAEDPPLRPEPPPFPDKSFRNNGVR